ncbi:MAG: Tm-1-like ATP-binding domain-containing protein [Pirellulaceae bacterium]
MSIYLLVTLDTKGPEAAFVRDRLKELGLDVTAVDAGCLGTPAFVGDVTREQVFAAAGLSLDELVKKNDRGAAVTEAAKGTAKVVRDAFAAGKVSGVLALGGSAGTAIGTAAMRELPIGVPKLMVSTLASGQVRPYVGDKDILMLNSVVDIAGINCISRKILNEAAAAMAGMAKFGAETRRMGLQSRPESERTGLESHPTKATADKPLIAATMFGVTTPCVQKARQVLEEAGCEVLVFHATGNGGQAMESLIRDGLIAGVLDITTTELADELVGGVLSAGPDRLTAAGKRGVPQVVSVGALDMVNFGPAATVPEKFKSRKFHIHNSSVTLMRTTPEENARLGEEIGRKVAASTGPACILLPLQGVSAIDRTGQSFDDPTARTALYVGIRRAHGAVELVELDNHINDESFAMACARKLLDLIRAT